MVLPTAVSGSWWVIPIPNQSAIFVGSVYGFSTYYLYAASVAFFRAALISSLI